MSIIPQDNSMRPEELGQKFSIFYKRGSMKISSQYDAIMDAFKYHFSLKLVHRAYNHGVPPLEITFAYSQALTYRATSGLKSKDMEDLLAKGLFSQQAKAHQDFYVELWKFEELWDMNPLAREHYTLATSEEAVNLMKNGIMPLKWRTY